MINKFFSFNKNNLLKICLLFFYFLLVLSCTSEPERILTGAERMDEYIGLVSGKKVAFTGNSTAIVNSVHLVDTLLSRGVDIVKVFATEHGFRGMAGIGYKTSDTIDEKTGIPVISLLGKKKQPSAEDLEGIDVVIFDIQDIGVRYVTYISTLHYVMESCAENGIPLIILDRPNPNGDYIDGPVLEMKYQSFVGIAPIPAVHGLTIGEFGLMTNGEGWLTNGRKCELTVIPCKNYDHSKEYILPVPAGPNIRCQQAVRLYASYGFFMGTVMSRGRGTENPYMVYGHPDLPYGDFYFTPKSDWACKNPLNEGKLCRGEDLRNWKPRDGKWKLEMQWLLKSYNNFPEKDKFFDDEYFNRVWGNDQLLRDIRAGKTEEEIRATWQEGISAYKKIREKYLLYP